MKLPKIGFLTKSRLAIIAIIVAWIIWGSTAVAAKLALTQIPVFTLIFYRLLLASLIVFPYLFPKLKELTFKDFLKISFAGFFGITLNIGFAFLGFQKTNATDATLIFSVLPLFELIAAGLFLRERITRNELIGIFLAFLGTGLIFVKPLLEEASDLNERLLGNFFIIISSLAWVVYTIYSKKIFTRFSPMLLTSASFLVGLFSFFPLMLWENILYPNWVANLGLNATLSFLYLAIFSSTLAYLIYEWGLKYSQVSKIGIFSNIQIIAATVLAVLVLGEKITPIFLFGAAFVIAGIFYSSLSGSPVHHHPHKHKV